MSFNFGTASGAATNLSNPFGTPTNGTSPFGRTTSTFDSGSPFISGSSRLFGSGTAASGFNSGGLTTVPTFNSVGLTAVPIEFDDAVSSLAWNPFSDLAALASWDGTVCVAREEAGDQWISTRIAALQAPILDCAWSMSGAAVVTGSTDGNLAHIDVQSGEVTSMGKYHTAPIRAVDVLREGGSYVTSGWDSTALLWDVNSGQVQHTLLLPGRSFGQATRGNMLCFITSNQRVAVFDARKLDVPLLNKEAPMKSQLRKVDISLNCDWVCVANAEGRCFVMHIDEAMARSRKLDFSFKCHRQAQKVYAVNDIHFHPFKGTFATVGGDGSFTFWDKEARVRLGQNQALGKKGTLSAPLIVDAKQNADRRTLVCGKFNSSGSRFGVVAAYDWSQGPQRAHKTSEFFVYKTKKSEVTPREARNNNRNRR